jgi:hypothetical protein
MMIGSVGFLKSGRLPDLMSGLIFNGLLNLWGVAGWEEDNELIIS